jgi:hypothetical protein
MMGREPGAPGYINLLLDYYDKKWKRVGASQFGSTERERFWLLDQL